jgi:hypothetical protein
MSADTTYTIDFEPIGDHLRVTIPELGFVLETAPGETRRDDPERVALAAISRNEHQQHQAAKAGERELKVLDVHHDNSLVVPQHMHIIR